MASTEPHRVGESESIVSLTQSLLSTLRSTFPTPTTSSLHPLSQLSSSDLTSTRSLILSTFSSLKSATTAFQSTVLDNPSHPRTALEKYLSLLKERSAGECVLGGHRNELEWGKRLIREREKYDEGVPVLSFELMGTGGVESSIRLLTSIGHSISLPSFRESSTLSFVGKLMVLDIEFESDGSIKSVRFSYALNGGQHDDEALAGELLGLLKGLEKTEEGDERVERRLKEVRRILRGLKEIDAELEEGGKDRFGLMKAFREDLVLACSTESSISLLSTPQTPFPRLLFHSPPSATFTISTPTSLSKSLTIKLSPSPPKTQVEYRAELDTPIVISKRTGRRIVGIVKGDDAPEEKEEMEREGESEEWLEDLLMENFSPSDTYQLSYPDTSMPYRFSLSPLRTHPGYLCSMIRFTTVEQLIKIVKILQEQETWNDLLRSGFREKIDGLVTSKKRKVERMNLDDLYSPPTFLPISLSLSPSSSTIHLTFPHQVKEEVPQPKTISISLVEGDVKVRIEDEEMERKLELVVGRTRDLGLMMRAWEKLR